MPFVHPIYDPRDDAEAPPPMTEEQMDYFSRQTKNAVRRAVRNYSRGALLGFFLLLACVGYVQYDQEKANQQAQQALIDSGRIVAVDGCNRDFRSTQRIRSLLERLQSSTDEAYKNGTMDAQRYAKAQAFYKSELDRQKLPDCRRAENILTNDPESLKYIPTPLYPKG